MIPLLIWAVKEVVEDVAENEVEAVAKAAADAMFLAIDGITLTDEEKRLCADADEVVAATLAKVKATLLKSNA